MARKIKTRKTAEQRRAEADALQVSIAQQVEQLRESDAWQRFLDFELAWFGFRSLYKDGTTMPRTYDPELRQRALRMLAEARPEHDSLTAACRHVGGLLGVSPETLRVWQRRYDVDTGVKPGVTTDVAEENRRLRRENAELKKANEVLKAASVFFAKEPGRPRTR